VTAAEPEATDTLAPVQFAFVTNAQSLTTPQVTPAAVPTTPVPALQPGIESYDLPQVMTGWSIDVNGVAPNASDTIFAINDVKIDDISRVDSLLHQSLVAPEGATIDLSVLVGPSQEAATLENVTVPVFQRTFFLNGTLFDTRLIDGSWNTIVVIAPAGQAFQSGDILVGDLATGTVFDARTSLPDVLVQANADNRDSMTFAVRREGEVVTIEINTPR
jgi:hypothetical protein